MKNDSRIGIGQRRILRIAKPPCHAQMKDQLIAIIQKEQQIFSRTPQSDDMPPCDHCREYIGLRPFDLARQTHLGIEDLPAQQMLFQ